MATATEPTVTENSTAAQDTGAAPASTEQTAAAPKVEKTPEQIAQTKAARRKARLARKATQRETLQNRGNEFAGQLGVLELGEHEGWKNVIEIHLEQGGEGVKPTFSFVGVATKGKQTQPLAVTRAEIMQAERRAFRLLDGLANPKPVETPAEGGTTSDATAAGPDDSDEGEDDEDDDED